MLLKCANGGNDRSFLRRHFSLSFSLSLASRVITIRVRFVMGVSCISLEEDFITSNLRRASINFPFCSPMRWRTGLEESCTNRLTTNQRIRESEFSCTFAITNRVTLECSLLFATEQRRTVPIGSCIFVSSLLPRNNNYFKISVEQKAKAIRSKHGLAWVWIRETFAFIKDNSIYF